MPDYGHELVFGSFVTPSVARVEDVLRLAGLTESLGLDIVAVQDHPYQSAFLDTWTLLSVLAARTERVRLVPDVLNLPLRPPAVLARAAASLDILSAGRVELGLGAGVFWDAIETMGVPRRTPKDAVDALAEAVGVLRALWTPGRAVWFDGEHYALRGARPGPFSPHPIGLWIGSYRRRMLQLTGRLGDAWLPGSIYIAPHELTAMNKTIDAAADAAGRRPAAIRRVYNLAGTFHGTGASFLQGTPRVWVEQLAELAVDEGISGFILMLDPDTDADTNLHTFAEEVAPAVRDLVDHERTRC